MTDVDEVMMVVLGLPCCLAVLQFILQSTNALRYYLPEAWLPQDYITAVDTGTHHSLADWVADLPCTGLRLRLFLRCVFCPCVYGGVFTVVTILLTTSTPFLFVLMLWGLAVLFQYMVGTLFRTLTGS